MEEHSDLSFEIKTSEIKTSDQFSDHFISPKIAGSFCIKNRQYLVIHIEQEIEDSAQFNLTQSDLTRPDLTESNSTNAQTSAMGEVGRFQVDGYHCMVVEADPGSFTTHSDVISRLTKRELQIVKLVAAGHVNKQVAKQLHISEWTVSTHLRRIFAKLGVDSRAAMVYRCAALLN